MAVLATDEPSESIKHHFTPVLHICLCRTEIYLVKELGSTPEPALDICLCKAQMHKMKTLPSLLSVSYKDFCARQRQMQQDICQPSKGYPEQISLCDIDRNSANQF